jgi:DNA-binding GntR family transcriptional regulator
VVAFEPLPQQPRAEGAAQALRRAILEGRLAPGTQIREVHVAAALGVSRAPLREALRSLEDEGLVVREPYRGAFVAEIGAETVQEIASLRVHLEPFAVERALPRLRGPDGSAALTECMARIETAASADDVPASIDAHLAIHRLFYELASHRLLLSSWRSWESQLRLYLAIDHSVFTGLDTLVKDHQRLVDLIGTARPREIRTEIRRHIERAADAVARSPLVRHDDGHTAR